MGIRLMRRAGMVLALAGMVSGCGLFDSEEERLDGERIRIRDQRGAQRNVELATAAPALPAPRAVADWTQTNGRADHNSAQRVDRGRQ